MHLKNKQNIITKKQFLFFKQVLISFNNVKHINIINIIHNNSNNPLYYYQIHNR